MVAGLGDSADGDGVVTGDEGGVDGSDDGDTGTEGDGEPGTEGEETGGSSLVAGVPLGSVTGVSDEVPDPLGSGLADADPLAADEDGAAEPPAGAVPLPEGPAVMPVAGVPSSCGPGTPA